MEAVSSGLKHFNLATYRIVSEGNCEKASGIEPVKLLCDRSLRHTYVDHGIFDFIIFITEIFYKIEIDEYS